MKQQQKQQKHYVNSFEEIQEAVRDYEEAVDVKGAEQANAQKVRKRAPDGRHNLVDQAVKDGSATEEEIIAQFNSTHSVIDPVTQELMKEYIAFQKEKGNPIYKDMTVALLIKRLFVKRPIAHFLDNGRLTIVLQNGMQADEKVEKAKKFIKGKLDDESLLVEDWLTDEEAMLGSLLVTTSTAFFINIGFKENLGRMSGQRDYHQRLAVITGLVGARLEYKGESEYPLFVSHPEDKAAEPGSLRCLMAKKIGGGLSYENTVEDARSNPLNYIRLYPKGMKIEEDNGIKSIEIVGKLPAGCVAYFNIKAYKEWLKLIIKPYLTAKNLLAGTMGKKCVIRVTGIGLGVWVVCSEIKVLQAEWLIEAYQEVMVENDFENIVQLDFANLVMGAKKYVRFGDGVNSFQSKSGREVPIIISDNVVATKIAKDIGETKKEDIIICSQYAWDSRSFPGNEYALGKFSETMDPAVSCCCGVVQSQNPLVNSNYTARAFVCGGKGMQSVDGGECSFEDIARHAAIGLGVPVPALDKTDLTTPVEQPLPASVEPPAEPLKKGSGPDNEPLFQGNRALLGFFIGTIIGCCALYKVHSGGPVVPASQVAKFIGGFAIAGGAIGYCLEVSPGQSAQRGA